MALLTHACEIPCFKMEKGWWQAATCISRLRGGITANMILRSRHRVGVLPSATGDRVLIEDDCYMTSSNRPFVKISLEIKTQIIAIEKKNKYTASNTNP